MKKTFAVLLTAIACSTPVAHASCVPLKAELWGPECADRLQPGSGLEHLSFVADPQLFELDTPLLQTLQMDELLNWNGTLVDPPWSPAAPARSLPSATEQAAAPSAAGGTPRVTGSAEPEEDS